MTPQNEPPAVVVIDQSTIYNLLLEVRDDVRDVKKDLAELANDSKDHESRLRVVEANIPKNLSQRVAELEAARWKLVGAGSVLGAVAGFLGSLLLRLLG